MNQKSLIALLRKHKDAAPDPHAFVRAVAANCNASKSSVYRWISNESKPSGEHVLSLVEHLKSIKEPQP